MVLRKKSIRIEELDARFDIDGVSVPLDWRYDLLTEYLRFSHSFMAVLRHQQGRPYPHALPSDFSAVETVVNDFGDIQAIGERKWWNTVGKLLFGIKAPEPIVSLVGELSASNSKIEIDWSDVDSAIISIPRNLTQAQAFRQIKKVLTGIALAKPINSPAIAPQYTLLRNKVRRETLLLGSPALQRYEQGWPLWKIGNWLRLIPSLAFDEVDALNNPVLYVDNKKALATAARRLVRFAALVAENAARGRFLTNEPFPEAMLSTYSRDAGRPKGSRQKK